MTTSHGAARKDGPPRKPREQYQHRTAGLLRELGFAAEMNDPLPAANGVVHKVGVSARIAVAGVNVLWIAGCKLWNRAVPKEKVSALEDIVNDLGADRGLLMSEKGFQSGTRPDRRRQLHPHHRLAPAIRPRRLLHRPRPGLARPPRPAAQALGMPPDQHFAPLPADADPDRAWIEEGLRRALALATVSELSALVALLTVESNSQDSLAGWLRTLVTDEMDRRNDLPPPAPSEEGKGGSARSNPYR